MSFYLLKSTNDRNLIGDAIFLKDEIVLIKALRVVSKKETYFSMLISLKSGDEIKGLFNTEDEVKNIMKDLGIDSALADDFILKEDLIIKKEEAMEQMKAMFG